MPKIGNITTENLIGDFINYKSVKTVTDTLKENLKKINTNVIETLNKEISSGGLDLYSANVNGVPIFHNKAVELQQSIRQLYSEGTELVKHIENRAYNHREGELTEYIEKLETRIREIENYIAANNNAIDAYNKDIANDPDSVYGNDWRVKNRNAAQEENEKLKKELEGSAWEGKTGLRTKLEQAKQALSELGTEG